MSNDNNVTGLNLVAKNGIDSLILRTVHLCRAAKPEYAFVNAGSLHNTAVLRYVSTQHGKTAVGNIGMFKITYTPVGAVCIQRPVYIVLRTQHKVAPQISRSTFPQSLGLVCIIAVGTCGIARYSLAQSHSVNTAHISVKQPVGGKLAKYGHYSAGTVNILHMVV